MDRIHLIKRMRRFYAPPEAIAGDKVELDDVQTGHLRRVLRLPAGETVNVFDGLGTEYLCRIERCDARRAVLRILGQTPAIAPESPLEICLAPALLKGEKFELVIRKAVELGVVKLVPLLTRRCDVRTHPSGKRLTRWRSMVVEASKQTGRSTLMEISEPVGFDSFATQAVDGEPAATRVLFAERGGETIDRLRPAGRIVAACGPEGGWEEDEIGLAAANGFQIVTAGRRILRAETASIVFAALLQHRFGDLS